MWRCLPLSAGRIELRPAELFSNHAGSKSIPTSICLSRVLCMGRFPLDIGCRLPRRHTDLRLLERLHLPALILSSQCRVSRLAPLFLQMAVIDAGNEERLRHEGITCPGASVVAGTKPESGVHDSAEWVREADIARHRVGFSAMQQSCDDCCIAENPTRLHIRAALAFASGRTELDRSKLSRSAVFVTSVCIACAYARVSYANLICLAIRYRCKAARI